jgi:hypothetical protein
MSTTRTILRGLAGLAVTLAVAGGLATGAGARAAQASTTPQILLNKNSSLCLGTGGSQVWEAQAVQEPCAGTPDEGWTAVPLPSGRYQISNGWGLCLGVNAGSTAQGAPVVQWGCNGSLDQQWIPGGATAADPDFSYQLVNANSGLCLGILGASVNQGAGAVQWSCNGSPDQRWNGTWFFGTVTDVNSGLCLGILGASKAAGAAAAQWPCNSSASQIWELDDSNRLQNSNDGMCLSVWGASLAAGARVVQWPCSGRPDQTWLAHSVGGQAGWQFTNANSGMCLGVSDTTIGQGAVLAQWPCDPSQDQQWAYHVSFRGGVGGPG